MALTSANYLFLPWVRQGAASAIATPDRSPEQAGVVAVQAGLRVNDSVAVEREVRLYGPGDVVGIDRQQVVRTEPRAGATDFEPNYFPAVEFDRPDFPWLFTPAKADAEGKLRPWLCLVVLRKQQGVVLHIGAQLLLPVLEIGAPARPEHELPDLAEAWAWAHVQLIGSARDAAGIAATLNGDPALTVSRLLCPRRLDPLTEYLACVVPTFALGRKAGLGEPIIPDDEQQLLPAWRLEQQGAPLRLPVYYHWEFRTGSGGDFEALVRRLEARDSADMPAGVGVLRVAIGRPGFEVVPALPPDATLELAGALRVPDVPPAPWPDELRGPFQSALEPILDAPWKALHERGHDPLLAPPIYGSWQAGRHAVELPAADPDTQPWLDQLNLDPRNRAVAALGAQVVQQQQEQLMAAAWQQLGELNRINQLRRQAQLGRAVNGMYHARYFQAFSPQNLLNIVAPAQSRVIAKVDNAPALLSRALDHSSIPIRAVSAPLRRISSPRGAVSARFRRDAVAPGGILARLNTTRILSFERQPAGLATINAVSDGSSGVASGLRPFMRWENVAPALAALPQLGDFRPLPEGFAPRPTLLSFAPAAPFESGESRMFHNAARAHQAYLEQQLAAPPEGLTERLDLDATRAQLLRSLDPTITISARVQAALVGGAPQQGDPLEPMLDAPEFPQPMYEALRDLAQEYLFPGLEHVPPDTVTLLQTNPAFVESLLAGLNDEMSRELLWRNYPTDQRSTYFRRFWDSSAGDGQLDIQPIHRWGDAGLGDNARAGGQLVLLLRGELLRRYPNAVIYAVAAVRNNGRLELSGAPADELHPLFRGTLTPDVTFVGFDLSETAARADPGYFFVIQQQPSEPSFGMDVADFEAQLPTLSSWDQLSWRHLAPTEQQLAQLSHASVTAALPAVPGATWGAGAAHQAYITLQRPVRIAIHASRMLKG